MESVVFWGDEANLLHFCHWWSDMNSLQELGTCARRPILTAKHLTTVILNAALEFPCMVVQPSHSGETRQFWSAHGQNLEFMCSLGTSIHLSWSVSIVEHPTYIYIHTAAQTLADFAIVKHMDELLATMVFLLPKHTLEFHNLVTYLQSKRGLDG